MSSESFDYQFVIIIAPKKRQYVSRSSVNLTNSTTNAVDKTRIPVSEVTSVDYEMKTNITEKNIPRNVRSENYDFFRYNVRRSPPKKLYICHVQFLSLNVLYLHY